MKYRLVYSLLRNICENRFFIYHKNRGFVMRNNSYKITELELFQEFVSSRQHLLFSLLIDFKVTINLSNKFWLNKHVIFKHTKEYW